MTACSAKQTLNLMSAVQPGMLHAVSLEFTAYTSIFKLVDLFEAVLLNGIVETTSRLQPQRVLSSNPSSTCASIPEHILGSV